MVQLELDCCIIMALKTVDTVVLLSCLRTLMNYASPDQSNKFIKLLGSSQQILIIQFSEGKF